MSQLIKLNGSNLHSYES